MVSVGVEDGGGDDGKVWLGDGVGREGGGDAVWVDGWGGLIGVGGWGVRHYFSGD